VFSFFYSICFSANVGDPLAGDVCFKGNDCVRYKDGKGVDRPDDWESSAANKASCADYKEVVPMMMAVRRRLARKWR